MHFHLGDFRVSIVSGGRFRLDGGSMFGVVPKPLWQKVAVPDPQNRIQLDTNCVLVDTGSKRILIDTGFGTRLSDKERLHHAVEGNRLLENLQSIGVQPDQVDLVIASHLHFDHIGGATTVDGDGKVRLSFPKARVVGQRLEWEDATSSFPELAGTYLARDVTPLLEAGVDWRIDGDAEIAPGVFVERTGAHTPGHQIIRLESRGQHAVYLGDLCPTANHLGTFWTMAYDQFPRATRTIKPRVLADCLERRVIVIFDHEPVTPAVTVQRDSKREFAIDETIIARNKELAN